MRFNRRLVAFAGVAALGLGVEDLHAQTATQTVRFSVVPISRVAISGSAGPIVVSTANPGSPPTSASMGGTSYAITTNESNQKIAAALDAPMPGGVSLAVALGAPAGAASQGSMTLNTASADLVTGITGVSAASLPIVYTLSASASATVAPGTRTVTYTIMAGQ
jgi:hypothetical protein